MQVGPPRERGEGATRTEEPCAPTPGISLHNGRAPFPAFEMTLTEGNKLERKIFYSTFATVSGRHSHQVTRAPAETSPGRPRAFNTVPLC